MTFVLKFLLVFLAAPIFRPIICSENTTQNLGKAIKSFEIQALEEHNRLRARHGSPPLKLNTQLSNYAKAWAEYLADRNTMKHRPNNKYGENIFKSSGMEVDGRTPVTSWYNEIKYYNFKNGGFSMATGHFTQVVWKNSKELGIGMAKRGKSVWVVANYSPPGNYEGQFQKNVPPLLK